MPLPITPLVSLADNTSLPLLQHYRPQQPLLINDTRVITQEFFLQDLLHLRERLPAGNLAFNVCEDRYFFMLAFCAALLNNTVNLLPPTRQRTVLNQIAADYPSCFCMTDTEIECDIPSVNIRTLLDDKRARTSVNVPVVPAQQLAAIAFTSGSTGQPCANKKYWGTLAGTAQRLAQRFTHYLSDPVIVATVPSQHMYGLEMTMMMALQGECTLHRDKPFYPVDIQRTLQKIAAPVVLVSTPIHLRAMVNAELTMPAIASVVSATAPLDANLALASEQCFNTRLNEIYGCTEAGSMATRASTQTQAWELLSGFDVQPGTTGFIANAPHLAEAAPLQDQLQLNSDGSFLLLGRNADMINVGGKRASLADLTLKLLRIDGVHDGVFFWPDNNTNERPVAMVVSDLPEKTILLQLAQQIDAAFLPRPLRKVKHLPRNETGKLTRAALQSLWGDILDQ